MNNATFLDIAPAKLKRYHNATGDGFSIDNIEKKPGQKIVTGKRIADKGDKLLVYLDDKYHEQRLCPFLVGQTVYVQTADGTYNFQSTMTNLYSSGWINNIKTVFQNAPHKGDYSGTVILSNMPIEMKPSYKIQGTREYTRKNALNKLGLTTKSAEELKNYKSNIEKMVKNNNLDESKWHIEELKTIIQGLIDDRQSAQTDDTFVDDNDTNNDSGTTTEDGGPYYIGEPPLEPPEEPEEGGKKKKSFISQYGIWIIIGLIILYFITQKNNEK
jgi:hypothetical protein